MLLTRLRARPRGGAARTAQQQQEQQPAVPPPEQHQQQQQSTPVFRPVDATLGQLLAASTPPQARSGSGGAPTAQTAAKTTTTIPTTTTTMTNTTTTTTTVHDSGGSRNAKHSGPGGGAAACDAQQTCLHGKDEFDTLSEYDELHGNTFSKSTIRAGNGGHGIVTTHEGSGAWNASGTGDGGDDDDDGDDIPPGGANGDDGQQQHQHQHHYLDHAQQPSLHGRLASDSDDDASDGGRYSDVSSSTGEDDRKPKKHNMHRNRIGQHLPNVLLLEDDEDDEEEEVEPDLDDLGHAVRPDSPARYLLNQQHGHPLILPTSEDDKSYNAHARLEHKASAISNIVHDDALLTSFPRNRDETELAGPPPRGQPQQPPPAPSMSPLRTAIAYPSPCAPLGMPATTQGGGLRGRAFGRAALRKLAKKLNSSNSSNPPSAVMTPATTPSSGGGPLFASSASSDSFKLRFSHVGAGTSSSGMQDDRESTSRWGHRRRSSYVGLFDEQLSFITPSTSESEYLGSATGPGQSACGTVPDAPARPDPFNVRNEPHSFAGWRSRPLYTPESSSIGSSDCGELAKAAAAGSSSAAIGNPGIQGRGRRRAAVPLPKASI